MEGSLERARPERLGPRTAAALILFFLSTASPAPQAASAVDVPLEASLRRIVESQPLSTARTSIQVLDAATGLSIYAHDPDLLLKPASNMKIVTAAAALALLRPEYRFRTSFHSARPPDASGVIRGDLHVKGGGDPGLVGEEWWLIARRMRVLGVTAVQGDLVGDDSFFDGVLRGPEWAPASVDNPYNAPVSALSCFYSAVAVTVRPTLEGRPPEVILDPFSSYFKVVNRAVTAGRGSDLRVGRHWDGRENSIHVDGRIGTNSGPIIAYKSVEEPTLYALSAFREAAGKEGISITGAVRRGVVPAGLHVLEVHESKPLADLIQDMNKESNNFMAESILKTIGAETMGRPGTAQKGAVAVRRHLEGLGVSTSGLVIADGSGLSSENRLSANALARILLAMHRDFLSAPEFMASLPIGGIDGTLDHRMIGTAAARKIRAKTGFINGVSTLSGYAWNDNGRLLVFSILVNSPRGGGDVNGALDRLCAAMVRSALPAAAPASVAPAAHGG